MNIGLAMGLGIGLLADAACAADKGPAEKGPAEKGTVLVVGATGQTGRPLVQILKAQGYTVRAMVRGATTAAELGADAVIKGDVTQADTLPPAVKGVTYVISAIGARGAPPEAVDYGGNVALADAAKAAGVKQMVLMTSVGAEITRPDDPSVRRGPMMILKGKAEAHLRKSGLGYSIVRPGALANCEAGKAGISLGLTTAAANRVANLPPICRADVAAVMAASLGNPAALGKTFTVVSDPNGKPDAWRKTFADLKKD